MSRISQSDNTANYTTKCDNNIHKNCTWEKVGLTRNLDTIESSDLFPSQDIEYLLHYVSQTIKLLNHSHTQDITEGKYNRQESIGKLLYL